MWKTWYDPAQSATVTYWPFDRPCYLWISKQDMQPCLKVSKRQQKWITWITPEGKMCGCQKIIWQKFFDPSSQVVSHRELSAEQSAGAGAGAPLVKYVFYMKPPVKETRLWKYVSQRGFRRYGVSHSRPTVPVLCLSPIVISIQRKEFIYL